MLAHRVFVTLLLALAAFGMPGPCGLGWAHSPFEPGAKVTPETGPPSTASEARREGSDVPARVLAAAPEMPGFPWAALAVVAAAGALGWRRPRAAAALALAVLLAVFAFEDGLHSVHHGLDRAPASSCSVAAAGTHLTATPVDGIAPDEVILPVVALTVEMSPPDPIARPVSPEQGRAPPRSLV